MKLLHPFGPIYQCNPPGLLPEYSGGKFEEAKVVEPIESSPVQYFGSPLSSVYIYRQNVALFFKQVPILTVKMVRFLCVTSLLLLSHVALVAADVVPPVPSIKRNNMVGKLLGRACPPDECEAYGIQPDPFSYSPDAQQRALALRAAVKASIVAGMERAVSTWVR